MCAVQALFDVVSLKNPALHVAHEAVLPTVFSYVPGGHSDFTVAVEVLVVFSVVVVVVAVAVAVRRRASTKTAKKKKCNA